MTTPVSGAISFLDLANEYQGPYGFQRYSLSMADVYNSANLVTGTVVTTPGTTSFTIAGNIITWSEDFTTSRWTAGAFGVNSVANQTTAPDGTLTADQLNQTGASGTYIQQNDVTTLRQTVQYTHSVYLKGLGTSVGRLCAIGNFDNGARVGQTSLTLTADWQRLSATFTGTATANRNIFIQTNGVAGSNMVAGQSVFVWGYQITTGSTLQAYNEYTRTTSTTRTTGTVVLATSSITTTTSVVARGAISMSQFYGITGPAFLPPVARTTITITVPSTTFTSNLDLYKLALGSGYTTGTTNVVLNIGTGAIVGSAGSSITESFSVSYASTAVGFARNGNIIGNSRNLSDGALFNGSTSVTVTTSIPASYGTILSPNQSTTGVALLTLTSVTGNDFYQVTPTNLRAATFYTVSCWLKGWGSSIGQKVIIGTNPTGNYTSITLTARWQRLQHFQASVSGISRMVMILNGGSSASTYTNNMLLNNQSVFTWGWQATSSQTASINQQYVETTSAIGVAGVGAIQPWDNYTTSETLTTSYAVYVPSRFNSGDTVTIVNNGTIVGESGKGGQGGSATAAPAAGYPTPTAGKVGGRGGDALGIFRPVTIDNAGTIAGGGGGGGGGNAGPGTTVPGPATIYSGGSGGGGAGADSNPGYVDINASLPSSAPAPSPANSYALGTPPAQASFTAGTGGIRNIGATSTATPGANGGALGTTGSTSTASPLAGAVAGGAPGHYVVGSPLVTWANTGTRSGTVG